MSSAFQINLRIGDPLPLYCCASGKLFLSTFEQKAALSVFENVAKDIRARNTITRKGVYADELKQISAQGYALDNEEWFDDMVGASVPIINNNGNLCACLSTHSLKTRKSLEEVEEHIPAMKTAAAQLGAIFFEAEGN